MKTQAWGWLGAAVLAAGLNSSYHNGGLQWAHEIADRVEHNSNAVLALATGRADQFLQEARMLNVDRITDSAAEVDSQDQDTPDTVVADNEECPFSKAVHVQSKFDGAKFNFENVQAISDREQARLDRLEASRVRIENAVRRLARVRVRTAAFNSVNVEIPEVQCPRVRVNFPRVPRVKVPAPAFRFDYSGPGPV